MEEENPKKVIHEDQMEQDSKPDPKIETNTFKKKWSKRKILSWLSALSICVFALVGSYVIYHNYQQQQTPTKQSAKITSKYGASNAPGSSSISKYPDSIRLTTDFSIPARNIFVPNLKITFSTPGELRTGQELRSSIADEANWASVVRLYRDNTKYTKDTNGYDTPDNAVIFSFDYPYGNDPIDGIQQEISHKGKDPEDTSLIDILSFKDSILASPSAVFYKYFDRQHYRYGGKETDTYKAIVRMDVVTDQGKHSVVGVVYTCYDQVNKKLCEQTFQMFVSSLKIDQATLGLTPPTYEEKDIFGMFPWVKKNLNSAKEFFLYDTNLFSSPAYHEEKVPAIAALKDEDLQNIRCMPAQLFFPDSYNPQAPEIVGTYRPYLSDNNLQNLIGQATSRITSQDYMLTQITACQTESNNYIVKYNLNPWNKRRGKDDVLQARIATIDEKGNFQDIISIPNQSSYCSHFIALTKDNMLYFACVPVYQIPSVGINIYKIDIAKKTYDKIYSCIFPSSSADNMAKYCK